MHPEAREGIRGGSALGLDLPAERAGVERDSHVKQPGVSSLHLTACVRAVVASTPSRGAA